jgi:hypothetical protein
MRDFATYNGDRVTTNVGTGKVVGYREEFNALIVQLDPEYSTYGWGILTDKDFVFSDVDEDATFVYVHVNKIKDESRKSHRQV